MTAMDAAAAPSRADASLRRGILRCELATETDDASLRALLRDTPMEGWVRLAFPREPSFFGSAILEGEHAGTVVIRRGPGGTVVALGSRAVKEVWWKGRPARLGYLGQLRFARGWKPGRRTLARAYELVRGCRAPDELPFDLTSIVADNEPARRLLERGLPGLPRYTPLAELVTVVVPARDGRPARHGIRVEEGRSDPTTGGLGPLRRDGPAAGTDRTRPSPRPAVEPG